MKRLTKQKKGFKGTGRVNVKAAGIVMAALMGVGSAAGAVGAVNVFASEEATVKAVSQEESVNEAESLTGSEAEMDMVNAESDASGVESEDINDDAEEKTVNTEEKTDESSAQNENTTSSDIENVENNRDIQMEKTAEDKKSSGVGAVNAVEAVKNGWVKASGGYKYYKNGKAYTGWHKMGKAEGEKTEHYSYFGSDGIIRKGWQSMGKGTGNSYDENTTKHMCYFGKDGWLRTGWQSMGKGTKNSYNENTAKHTSYFGKDGWLRTGWQSMGKGTKNSYDENTTKHTSYFGKDGWLRTGWQSMGKGTKNSYGENTSKHTSYFGKDGWLRTGWQSMGKGTGNSYDENTAKHTSYFGKDGWLRTGWQSMGKKTKNSYDENTAKHMSYFGKDGWLRTGWQSMGKGTGNSYDENTAKHTSYFGKDGWLRTGLQSMGNGTKNSYDENSKNHMSYFGNDGWLRVSQKVTVNGKSYMADGRGWLSVLHEENDLFMERLRAFYRSSDIVDGIPDGMWTKYAIADFDGDGSNELMVEKKGGTVGNALCMFEADSINNNLTPVVGGFNYYPFEDITFLDNGVAYVTANHNRKEAKGYYLLNTGWASKLNYNLSLVKDRIYSELYVLYTDRNGIVEKGLYGYREEYFKPKVQSREDYEREIKMLESGNVMNIQVKYFTAKNIGL